jgi:predicted nucleic acid-binding protein
MKILVDASAIMAVIMEEPGRERVINLTKNAVIVSPNIVGCEIGNGLTKMMRKKIIDKKEMIESIQYFKRLSIKLVEIDLEKALNIAWEYKIYAYDAYYLESAKRLNLSLLTFDENMGRIGKEIGLTILGGK